MAIELKDVHKKYLEQLRRSGETNMYGAAPYLAKEFQLSNEVANEILCEWMRTYKKGDYLT